MREHVVEAGDTLGAIAKRYLGSANRYMEIAKLNHLENPDLLSLGQKLFIPDGNTQADIQGAAAGIEINKTQLSQIMPASTPEEEIDTYLVAINKCLFEFKIDTPLRAAHFLAQVGHESAGLKSVSENLNYSAKALCSVFGKYFDEEKAQQFARKPEQIANLVYANRLGNGDQNTSDGWRFRGRGLIQLTGKDNYKAFGEAVGKDLVDAPESVARDPELAVAAAGWFWQERNINLAADHDDVESVTRLINGGVNGLEDRKAYLERAKKVLEADG